MRSLVVLALGTLVACGGGDSDCEEGVVTCDGTVLQECVDGVVTDLEDCSDEGMICHEEHGHCMLEGGTTEHM